MQSMESNIVLRTAIYQKAIQVLYLLINYQLSIDVCKAEAQRMLSEIVEFVKRHQIPLSNQVIQQISQYYYQQIIIDKKMHLSYLKKKNLYVKEEEVY